MLLDQIQTELKESQLNKNELKVSTLRLLLSEIKNAEIAKGGQLEDSDIVSIIQREVKKRKEAVAGFRSGGREEQAIKEENEANVLRAFLPAQLTNEELTKIVENTITELGASSISDMGKVIGAVMSKVAGQADGGTVSSLVKDNLLK